MATVIFVRGIQGSGKTTWAKNWVNEDPENRVRISWDDIRRMLGKYWVPTREGIVKHISLEAMKAALIGGKDVVIDNMNLGNIKMFIQVADAYGAKVVYEDFRTPLEECIARDAKRNGDEQIGEKIIRDTYYRYYDFYYKEPLGKTEVKNG